MDIVLRARDYLAENAAESGADVLIAELSEALARERLYVSGLRIALANLVDRDLRYIGEHVAGDQILRLHVHAARNMLAQRS